MWQILSRPHEGTCLATANCCPNLPCQRSHSILRRDLQDIQLEPGFNIRTLAKQFIIIIVLSNKPPPFPFFSLCQNRRSKTNLMSRRPFFYEMAYSVTETNDILCIVKGQRILGKIWTFFFLLSSNGFSMPMGDQFLQGCLGSGLGPGLQPAVVAAPGQS